VGSSDFGINTSKSVSPALIFSVLAAVLPVFVSATASTGRAGPEFRTVHVTRCSSEPSLSRRKTVGTIRRISICSDKSISSHNELQSVPNTPEHYAKTGVHDMATGDDTMTIPPR
jgi:hypothetical protein